MTIVNDNVELWCKMISRFMLLCSMSMFTTYVLYRALEIEHINKKHFLQPYNFSENRETFDLPKKYKFILWINHKEKDGMAKFSDCRYSNCILTSNEDFISRGRIDLFDAVIVSIEGYKEDPKAEQLMSKFTKRNEKQIYIMRLHESPRPDVRIPFVNRKFIPKHFFNWTWSYKEKSDIYDPYGYKIVQDSTELEGYYWKSHNLPIHDMEELENRKLVFWLVSHCSTGIKREGYAQKLKQFIDVDIYGKCSGNECSKKGNDCFQNLSMQYMFYLAFENSICDDYATEKFFRSLLFPIIPIVMGGANYKAIAPPKSYIDVNDFESPKQLSQFLIKLSKNKAEYNSYFEWKKSHRLYTWQSFCQLCDYLNDPPFGSKTIKDAYEWWYLRDNGELTCSNGSERNYYKTIKDMQVTIFNQKK